MMKRQYFFMVAMLLLGFVKITTAQELSAEVTINTPKLQTVDPKVFQTLETAIQEFLNGQNWTGQEYEQFERIKVNVQITIDKEVSEEAFEAEMSIQAVRPVYGSSYETPIFTHRDQDFNFQYQQFQPLEFTENGFASNLTQILAYYSYVILGLDGDSFAPFGGQPWFDKAQEILNNVPSNAAAAFGGWQSLDNNRNRYWLIENLMSPRVRPYRQAMYDYHRQGLDIMHSDAAAGRAIIRQSLEELQKVNRAYPNSMIMQTFANTKSNEIVDVFQQGSLDEKRSVRNVMSRIDAANASKYTAISR